MNLHKLFYLPEIASAHGYEVDFIIYLIHMFMFILFIGWGIFFFMALIKFRKGNNPKANYTGVQSHVTSYIEVGVVLFEAVLLIGLCIPFWAKQVNAFPERKDVVRVKIIAEQFAWNVHYSGADGVFGKTALEFFNKQSNPLGLDPNDPFSKDDITTINQLHLPIGKPAIIYLTSRDVIHSFFLPEMRVKQDVIPGLSIPVWFTPTKTGQWEIACAQLCGIGHYRMKGFLTIHDQEGYKGWLDEQAASLGGGDEGYDDFWN